MCDNKHKGLRSGDLYRGAGPRDVIEVPLARDVTWCSHGYRIVLCTFF